MDTYDYRPNVRPVGFVERIEKLKKLGYRVVCSAIDNVSPGRVRETIRIARSVDIVFKEYEIDVVDYEKYAREAAYSVRYPDYYVGNQKEKALEDYIALKLPDIDSNDVFIDVAS